MYCNENDKATLTPAALMCFSPALMLNADYSLSGAALCVQYVVQSRGEALGSHKVQKKTWLTLIIKAIG